MPTTPIWRRVRAWLLPDATTIAKRAWSLRLIEAAAIADLILNVVPYFSDFLPWWLTIALLVGAWVARLLPQGEARETE
jgi:hypothetical protein